MDRRFTLTMLGVFAGVALFLAVVGLYGVISFLTTQRTNEIGVRMALGASARDILALIVGQALILVVAGIAIGLPGAVVATRSLRSLLFGITPTDPGTFVFVTVLLLIVALAAAAFPAQRLRIVVSLASDERGMESGDSPAGSGRRRLRQRRTAPRVVFAKVLPGPV